MTVMRFFLVILWLGLGLPAAASEAEVRGTIAVIDGDTIDVGGQRIRLFGIDAPEQDQTCQTRQGVTWACGAWVTEQVRRLYGGKSALCRQVDQDRYGRIVATCEAEGTDIGQRLVSDGLAFAYRRYSMAYDLDEKGAAISDRGLHGSRVQVPSEFRQTRATRTAPTDRACTIKGNISSKGHRIYHIPGQVDYDRTGIREDKGERWFCSTREAEAAGWRAAKR